MADERFQSVRDFFPYYLSEHRHPVSRRLHFVGTTGFVVAAAVSATREPLWFPLAMAAMLALGAWALHVERSRRPLLLVLAMIALPAVAAPVTFLPGVVFAYGCAWVGHFGFEGNRPATFQYPVMSLASDFRMMGHMVRGRLWSGDPNAELGLTRPAEGSQVPV